MIPQSQLEPCKEGSRPPIFVRLTQSALEALKNNPSMSIDFTGTAARLKLGKLELQGSLSTDPGSVELFVKNGDGFSSQGFLEKRLVLRDGAISPPTAASSRPTSAPVSSVDTNDKIRKPAKPTIPQSTGSSAGPLNPKSRKASPKPKHRPLVHQAALGEITPASLARESSCSVEEAREFLLEFASAVDSKRNGAGDPFVLNDETYLYVRPWEYDYSPEDRNTAIDFCRAALDRMKIGPEHTARKSLRKPLRGKSKEPAPKVKEECKSGLLKKSSIAANNSSASANAGLATSRSGTTTSASSLAKNRASRESSTSSLKETSGSSGDKLSKKLTKSRSQSAEKLAPEVELEAKPAKRTLSSTETPSPKRLKEGSEDARATSRSSSSNTLTKKQPSSAEVSSELKQLAKKFRATYSEYSKLHASLVSLSDRPNSQVKRLLTMHRELSEWKNRLWSGSGEKRALRRPHTAENLSK